MMMFSNLCPFCLNSRLKNNNIINLPAEDSILYENNYFYVVVDIAPLMRGHLLIIPKKHYLNFGELPEDMKKEAKIIKKKIKKIYQDVYNSDALFFEHGSTDDISAGSSINHAHLHSLPLDIDLLPILDDNFPLRSEEHTSELQSLA